MSTGNHMSKQKMTWDERWEMHWQLNRKYREEATAALRAFRESMNESDWEDYLKASKLANKHWGIHQAMWTKKDKAFREKYGI